MAIRPALLRRPASRPAAAPGRLAAGRGARLLCEDRVEVAAPRLGVTEHVRVVAAGGEEPVVRAARDDAPPRSSTTTSSASEIVDGRWATMNVASLRHVGQSGADPRLGLDVDARGGIVEDEDARVHDEGAGDRQALALTAREREVAFADHRVVAVGQRGDELVRLAILAAALAPSPALAWTPGADVLGDGGREEEGVLGDDTDVAAQVGELRSRTSCPSTRTRPPLTS